MCVTDVLEVHLRNCIIKMCRRKLPAAVPPCNQSQICFRIIKCLRAIISSASSCISFKTSFSHGKEKVKTFVSSSSLFMKTHCFYHTLWLPYLNLCSRNLFFFFPMDYMWYIAYEHSTIGNSQLYVRMETQGGTDNPKPFYIWLSNTLGEFALGGSPSC